VTQSLCRLDEQLDGEEFLMDLKGIFLYTAELMLLDPVDAANRSEAAPA
jgi:hypothetical protein